MASKPDSNKHYPLIKSLRVPWRRQDFGSGGGDTLGGRAQENFRNIT